MKILIATNSRPLRNGKENAKNYAYWPQVIKQLETDGHKVTICPNNISMKEMEELVNNCNMYICVDTFLQHIGQYLDKPGIVIWTVSDPQLFGYSDNINLLKDRKYLRINQYDIWENTPYNKDASIDPAEVIKAVEYIESRIRDKLNQ